jgi:hypothetical protein
MGAFPMSTKVMCAVSLVVLLSGCTTMLQMAKPLTSQRKPASITQVHLDALKGVLVAVPCDGDFADSRYLRSGQEVAEAIAEAFATQGVPVAIAERQLANEEAILTAARLKAGYLVLPVITHWDQRNEWFTLPSKLAVRISMVDVATGRVIDSKLVETRNLTGLAFIISDPGTLLAKPLHEYVHKLYSSPAPLAALHRDSLPAYGLDPP